MHLYTIKLRVNAITASRRTPLSQTLFVKYAREYIPATQLYGLLVKAIVLHNADGRIGDSMLNVLELVRRYEGLVGEVHPALPYVEHRLINELAAMAVEATESLVPRLANRVEEYLNTIPSLKTVIRVQKFTSKLLNELAKTRCGFNILLGERPWLPIGILVVLPLILLENRVARKACEIVKSLTRDLNVPSIWRTRTGVMLDRVRRSAAPGRLYTYQYASLGVESLVAAATLNIEDAEILANLVSALGVGFKKNVTSTIEDVEIILTGSWRSLANILAELALLTLKAIESDDIREVYVAYIAYDASLLPIGELYGKLVHARIYYLPQIYLELFNTFYHVEDRERKYVVVDADTEVVIRYACCTEQLEEHVRRVVKPDVAKRFEVYVSHPTRRRVTHIERELVLSKLAKTYCNIVPVIIPRVAKV